VVGVITKAARRKPPSITQTGHGDASYHWKDMPSAPSRRVRHDVVEEAAFGENGDVALQTTGDRPPPSVDV